LIESRNSSRIMKICRALFVNKRRLSVWLEKGMFFWKLSKPCHVLISVVFDNERVPTTAPSSKSVQVRNCQWLTNFRGSELSVIDKLSRFVIVSDWQTVEVRCQSGIKRKRGSGLWGAWIALDTPGMKWLTKGVGW
jgi:hypothetical protein